MLHFAILTFESFGKNPKKLAGGAELWKLKLFAQNIWRTVAAAIGATLENGSAGIQFHEAQFRPKYYRPPCLCAYNPMTRHIKVAQ